MFTSLRIFIQLQLHRALAWVQLLLVVYALTYSGIHQFNNPAVWVEECELINHHLHQNPDTHACDLCDYHLRFNLVDTRVEISPQHYHKVHVIKKVNEPLIELTSTVTTRGPPVS